MQEQASVISKRARPVNRKVKKVPFVELKGGRLQGVVSSGSDVRRVYVSFVEAGTGNYYCCTNNNRPCGGLRGCECKHIHTMIEEAVVQFGLQTVAKYLGVEVEGDPKQPAYEILMGFEGSEQKESPGMVFSRFLNYLRYCELEAKRGSMLEMNWFAS